MALNKTALEADLLAMFTSMNATPMTPAQQAAAWATVLDSFVKTGSVSGVAPVTGGNATITNLPVS